MAIAQVSLQTKPPAALFALQVEALASAVDQMRDALVVSPANERIQVDSQVIGPATADLIADALGKAPDHIPDTWKE